ncbi:transposase [Agrobacterium vitis]|uniref:transposase n=2 Tax=Agrobacterium vitis TaxID=373 RepID=UPI00398C5C9C
MVWISEDALIQWSAPQRKSRGDQRKYSDLAITMCLSLRFVYDQPLRQTPPRNRERQLPLQGQIGRTRTEERRKGQSLIRKPYSEVAHI